MFIESNLDEVLADLQAVHENVARAAKDMWKDREPHPWLEQAQALAAKAIAQLASGQAAGALAIRGFVAAFIHDVIEVEGGGGMVLRGSAEFIPQERGSAGGHSGGINSAPRSFLPTFEEIQQWVEQKDVRPEELGKTAEQDAAFIQYLLSNRGSSTLGERSELGASFLQHITQWLADRPVTPGRAVSESVLPEWMEVTLRTWERDLPSLFLPAFEAELKQ